MQDIKHLHQTLQGVNKLFKTSISTMQNQNMNHTILCKPMQVTNQEAHGVQRESITSFLY